MALVDYRRPIEAMIPDAQGRLLGVLARTETELNLRALAELAGVSSTHASRVMPRLVALGIVHRRDVGTTSLFRLVEHNLAARWLRELGSAIDQVVDELRRSTRMLKPSARNVTLFGSFARHDADAESDVDLVVVAPGNLDDPVWREHLAGWEDFVAELVGNPVNLIETTQADAARQLRSRAPLWRAILKEGIHVAGDPLDELAPRTQTPRVGR